MSEVKFRMASLLIVFGFLIVSKSFAEDQKESKSSADIEVREIDRALDIAQEVQALNRGDFDARRGRFHPQFHMQLDEKTLSLSVNNK